MTLTNLLAEHSGSTIAAAVGDRVRVRLDENPTTGYRWQSLAQSGVLNLVDDEFVPVGDGGIGAGGTRTLEYEAIAAGRGSLKLGLTRAWEPEREPLHTFGIALEISAGRSKA